MAMNPRDAANAKGCIDSVISFTNTKLLPHVPEITIRFIHSVENRKFPMPLSQINFDRSRPTQYGESGRTSNTIDLLIKAAAAAAPIPMLDGGRADAR
jgi:hypothetical protein